jgi:hypothetical protein
VLGGYISDLEAGDVFEPVQYTLTPFAATAYAIGNEETLEWFHSSDSPWDRQVRPPTMIHSDKMRLLEANCTKERRIAAMAADSDEAVTLDSDARIHFEYHAKHHSPAFVGEELVVSGQIKDRYEKRGRTYLQYELQVHTAEGRLVTTYLDRTVLKYRKAEA